MSLIGRIEDELAEAMRARDGLRRLRMREYLKPSATAPTSGPAPHTALLYRVYGDE